MVHAGIDHGYGGFSGLEVSPENQKRRGRGELGIYAGSLESEGRTRSEK